MSDGPGDEARREAAEKARALADVFGDAREAAIEGRRRLAAAVETDAVLLALGDAVFAAARKLAAAYPGGAVAADIARIAVEAAARRAAG